MNFSNNKPISIIINADDFGLSKEINKGIIKAHKEGILTSTSICANGEEFNNAVEFSRENPTLDIGIHLILVGEKPLGEPNKIKSLVNNDGLFFSDIAEFTKRYFLGKINLEEVKYELSLQFKKVKEAGVSISHIDSHQHVHSLFGIQKIVQEFAKQYNIQFIRTTHEKIKLYMFQNIRTVSRIIQLIVLNFISLKSVKNSKFSKIKYFTGFFTGGNLGKENLKNIIQNLPHEKVVEIMCHPGLGEKNSKYSFWEYNHEVELSALINLEIRKLIDDRNIELTNFRKLYTKLNK